MHRASMRIAMDFVKIFYLLCTLRGCSTTPACDYSSQRQVIRACTTGSFSTSAKESTFYLDTGTGSNHEENLCPCSLAIPSAGIHFIFRAGDNIKEHNHSIKVDSHVLNSTFTMLDIVLTAKTDILIKTYGVGGVCVSVDANQTGTPETFGINCNLRETTTLTTTMSSNILTSKILQNKTNLTATSLHTYLPDENKENLIGPVVGGVSGFVVLVSLVAIVIFCTRRRKQKVQKDNFPNSDKSSNDQVNVDYIDMRGNLASVNSVADDRAISLIDVSYDDVKVDRDVGYQKDKKKADIKQTHTENNYNYASNKDFKTECSVSSGEAIESREDIALYTAVNKPPKMQDLMNKNEHNFAVYSAVNKPPKIQTYNSQDNVYDRTDSCDDAVRKMEDYDRLGAAHNIGIATEDTYECAATTGRNQHFNQDDYDTSHGIM